MYEFNSKASCIYDFIILQTRIGEERNYLSSGLVAAVRKADSKLVFIPMVFVLLRMWGTLQFFYGFAIRPTTEACIHTNHYHGLVFIGVMQVSKNAIAITYLVARSHYKVNRNTILRSYRLVIVNSGSS